MRSKDTKQLELDKPQEDEQIHDGDVQQNEYEEIQPALEKIEKNQDQILPIQDKIKKNRDEKDKKDDLKAKLSIEIGIDNNELYETVDNGIMKTVFRAKTMEDLAESEKEFLADFKRKMVAKRRFHEFSMNKKSSSDAAKAEMDKSWANDRSNENIFQATKKDDHENSESDEEVMGYSENNLQNLLNVLNKLRQERESFDEKRSVEKEEKQEWIKANQFKQWPHFDDEATSNTEKEN